MGKEILILNGSPRLMGNTSMLCDAFSRGAESSEHRITRFDLARLKIQDCLGCLRGGKDFASPCVQKDDMDKIYPAYREADVIVLASPLHWLNFSALLKRAFDRIYAFYEYEQKNSDSQYQPIEKESVLIMSAGHDTPDYWTSVSNYYESLVKLLNWHDRGRILAGGLIEAGDVKGKPVLEEAQKLGASL